MHLEPVTRSAAEWYAEAERAYVERHQGCPWCGGSHRVHQVQRHGVTTLQCQRCDFQVSFDAKTRRYRLIPGEDLSQVSETMLGGAIFAPAPK